MKTNHNNSFISNARYIESWYNFLTHAMPYHLFVTFEYDIPQSDQYAENGMSFLLKAVQRQVYSNSYIKQNDCFQGFSIAERHTKSVKKLGKFHFHNLINFGSLKPSDEFVDKVMQSFDEKRLKLTYNTQGNQTQIAKAPTAIDVKWDIYDQKNLVDYCLKDSEKEISLASKVSFIDWRGASNYEYLRDVKLCRFGEKHYIRQ